jgi:hypothetical protein
MGFGGGAKMDIDGSSARREWEYFGTLRVPHPNYEKTFWRDIVKRIQIEEQLQITLLFAYMTRPDLHIHFLAAGRSKSGKILADVDWKKWEARWALITRQSPRAMVVKPVFDGKGAVKYIYSDKNLCGDPDGKVSIYNLKLFRKLRPTFGGFWS